MKLSKRGRTYWIRVQVRGRRIHESLRTDDPEIARARAARRYRELLADPGTPTPSPAGELTLGEVTERYLTGWTEVRPTTRRRNAGAIRRVMLGAGMTYRPDLPVSVLSAEVVRAYRERMAAAGRPVTTINSEIASAQSVFARAIVEDGFYGGPLPESVLGFARARKARHTRDYHYRRPLPAVIEATRAAIPGLLERDRNAGLVVVLALGAGLRKAEIANAKWSWVGADALTVTTAGTWKPKSGRSRRIPLDPALSAVLEGFREPDGWVLRGSDTERTDEVFRRVVQWLRALGWSEPKPLHELRKEFGSRVAEAHGIDVASDLLGHSSISITMGHYRAFIREVRIDLLGS